MVTVVDPNGSPTVVYNKSGSNIQAITVVQGAGVVGIQNVSGDTVCIVSESGTPLSTDGVRLPANAGIGDKVSVCSVAWSGSTYYVFMPVGETIYGFSSMPPNTAYRFVKVTASSWLLEG